MIKIKLCKILLLNLHNVTSPVLVSSSCKYLQLVNISSNKSLHKAHLKYFLERVAALQKGKFIQHLHRPRNNGNICHVLDLFHSC